MFLVHLKELSEEFGIPVEVVAIRTNPAKQLYMRMGFQLFKEQDIFCYFKYEDRKEILAKNKSKKFYIHVRVFLKSLHTNYVRKNN